jgi:hypothetical protein
VICTGGFWVENRYNTYIIDGKTIEMIYEIHPWLYMEKPPILALFSNDSYGLLPLYCGKRLAKYAPAQFSLET